MKKIKLTLIIAFAIIGWSANAQLISTIAGDSVAGYNNDGILAINAELNAPTDVALDKSGNIYIADFLNQRIRKITISTGIISTIAGTGTAGYNGDGIAATSAELNSPRSIAIDDSGNVYIADVVNERIRKITLSNGMISTIAGTGTAGYNGDGISATTAELNHPHAITLDNLYNLYIADFTNHRIRKVTSSTGLISTIADTPIVSLPQGVAIDASGNVYISDADPGNPHIFKINIITGDTSTIAQSPNVSNPEGLIVDGSGNVYYADGSENRIRKITVGTGVNSIIAGNGNPGFGGDGILATFAELFGPGGVALDTSGNIYIADGGNNRIRKVNMNTGIPGVNNSLINIFVYPNPNNGNFTLSFNQLGITNYELRIYDVLGQEVYHQAIINPTQSTINLTQLSNGVYFYQLLSNQSGAKETYRGKFVKN